MPSLVKSLPKQIPILTTILLVSSCTSQQISTRNHDGKAHFSDKNGYLLMGVNNKLHLEKITISGEKNLHLSNSDLRSGSRYILASVPSGDYYLKNAKISHYWRFDFDASNWQFSIKPGKINYIGDIVIDNPGYLRGNETFEFINRSSYALEFLESEFPRLLESSKVTYAGPGTDNFIEFIQERY